MTRTRLAAVIGLALVLLLLGMAAAGALVMRGRALPVYVEGQGAPSGGYATNLLRHADLTYVSGKAEFRLQPLHEAFRPAWAIGRTAADQQVFRPDGQTGTDYIYTSGEMEPETVYRDSRLAPLEPGVLRVREIRLVGGPRPAAPRRSQDARLIGEVLASLAARPSVPLRPDYAAGDQNCRLDLLPEQAPGLAYTVAVLATPDGRTYFSTEPELSQDIWIPAGDLFTSWLRQ